MQTIRKKIIELLTEREMDARQLSQILGIQEKEIYRHLKHVEKSVARSGKKLSVEPFQCLHCGYTFRNRRKFTSPGRCPKCKSTYLEKPFFKISS